MKNVWRICVLFLLGIVIIIGSISCGGDGIPQEDYDEILDKLADAQDEISTLQGELLSAKSEQALSTETGQQYNDLLKEYNAKVDTLESLEAQYSKLNDDYDELSEAHTTLQEQNNANTALVSQLKNERNQLQIQINQLLAPLPVVTADDIEQALISLINQARTAAGLSALQEGINLQGWAEDNSRAMSVAKQNIIYSDHFAPYQQAYIAIGYETAQDTAAYTMTIWKSNNLQYQNNIMASDAIYGAVGVVKLNDIFYITFISSNFP